MTCSFYLACQALSMQQKLVSLNINMRFQLTQMAVAELLRLSLVAETQGNCYIDFLADVHDNGMMHIRIRPGCYNGEPIYRSNGVTLYASTSQLQLLNGLTLSYVDNIGGGGFLITTPPGSEPCSCGSGFRSALPISPLQDHQEMPRMLGKNIGIPVKSCKLKSTNNLVSADHKIYNAIVRQQ